MAAKLLMYYPENDLALAAGTASYTPPPAARELHRAGEALPLWMAAPGDRFVCSGLNDRWYSDMCSRFGIRDVDVYDHSATTLQPSPWGWSRASRRALEDAGFPPALLPDDATLDHLRELSHRRTAIALHRAIAPLLPFAIAPAATEARDAAAVESFLRDHPRALAKAPWSCSGRGLVRSSSMPEATFVQQCAGIIRRQGSVMLEPEHDKDIDFALLFECDGRGEARFCGISVFSTTARGGYTANRLASQRRLSQIVAGVIGSDRIEALVAAVARALPAVLPGYCGPVGIDMLATRDGTIDATVELNLRYTMGFLALGFSRYLDPHAEGTLEVLPSPGAPAGGCTIAGGLLADGELDLTPPHPAFAFRARVHRT